ncbi:MAG TPA: hypothetical protein VIY52_30700 [Streptosporangiaceae bacterium]
MFIHWGKHGTSSAGLTNAYAVALSMGLRHRVPLPELIRPGLDQDFGPNGRTDDPEIPRVRSAVDYVARRLAIDWLPYADRAALGVFTRTERVRHRQPGAGHPALPRRTRQQPGDHHLENFGQRLMRRSSVMMPRRCAPDPAALRSRRCCRRAISSGVSSMSRLDHRPPSLTAR